MEVIPEPTTKKVCSVLVMKHATLVTITIPRLDLVTAPDLEKVIDELIQAGIFKIVVEFTGCSYISSDGLRVLLSRRKVCKRWNRGDVRLAVPRPHPVREKLELVGVTRTFEVYETAVEAVGNF